MKKEIGARGKWQHKGQARESNDTSRSYITIRGAFFSAPTPKKHGGQRWTTRAPPSDPPPFSSFPANNLDRFFLYFSSRIFHLVLSRNEVVRVEKSIPFLSWINTSLLWYFSYRENILEKKKKMTKTERTIDISRENILEKYSIKSITPPMIQVWINFMDYWKLINEQLFQQKFLCV